MNGIWGIYLLSWLILLLLGYFLGCLNGSVMVSHFVIRDDVRQHGSGNAGLTNFYRTYGAKYALGVILFDMGKTVVACLLGGVMFNHLFGDWALGVLLGALAASWAICSRCSSVSRAVRASCPAARWCGC